MLKHEIVRLFKICCMCVLFFRILPVYGVVENDALKVQNDRDSSLSITKKKIPLIITKYKVPRTPKMTNPLDTKAEWLSDCKIICKRYRDTFGEYPNLANPVTFSEKIAYKELYDRRPVLTQIADKIKVRNYVKSRIGAEYLQEIYQVAKTPEGIDWDHLPTEFVIKTNHGSGWNIIVHDKNTLDLKKTKSQMREWLNKNYYDQFREWCYKHIPRLVFVEKLMVDDQGKIPTDWKFFVFSGRAVYLQVNIDRFENNKCNIYDRNLQKVNVRYHWENFSTDVVFPPNIEEMFVLAERLGEGLDFVRVDLYNLNGRIFFGEMTNYPLAGLAHFTPHEFDKQLGDCWTVPARY